MRELNLDYFPADLRGQNLNSRNGKGTPKGQPKSESCRQAMREAYQKRRASGWRQVHSKETRLKKSKWLYHTPDGIMLVSAAMKHYNLSKPSIIARCESKNFEHWYRIPKEAAQ